MTPEEKRSRIEQFLAEVDWHNYDYTTAPGADMSFPDFEPDTEDQRDVWIGKHYNGTSGWSTVHVPDLNLIISGEERRLLAVYGVPVEWPRKDEAEDELEDLLDEMDSARDLGGEDWAEAMDAHGILNDEHYIWMRGRSLGIPEEYQTSYEKAKELIDRVNAAKAADEDPDDIVEEAGFKDLLHFQYFEARVAAAKAQAWAAHNAVLRQTQAMLQDRFEKNKEALKDELAPFKGVSMEDWALANAKLTQGTSLDDILQQMGIERPLWDEVNAEWNNRMSRDTTATIATVYGQAFANAGQGQFGGAGQAVAASMEAGFGSDVGGGDPIPFEDWVKIQCHISAAAAQGVDTAAVLKQYNMNAADWGTIGGYWSQKMNSNPQQYLEQYQTFMAKYTAQFASGGAGSDIDF